jgi:hypothetical protein
MLFFIKIFKKKEEKNNKTGIYTRILQRWGVLNLSKFLKNKTKVFQD